MRKMKSLVYGIGDKGFKYPVAVDRVHLTEYKLWIGLLARCSSLWQNRYPTYIGCTVSDNFKSYSFFYEWCQEQIGFKCEDENNRIFQLDKDLLIKGNKHYSEDTCVFVPQAVNKLLTKRCASRGNYPIGVSFEARSNKFVAFCNYDGANRRIGRFKTISEAFIAYKKRKEFLIAQAGEKYISQIDPRAYEALMNYEVNIND